MHGCCLAVLLLCLPAAAQPLVGTPRFPPDIIENDSPIRDLPKLDAKHVRIDHESPRMRVLRINLAANESVPTHDARDGVLVCITACTLTFTNPVGYTQDIKLEAGKTLWMPAARHRITTAAPVEFLYIESKKPQ